MTQKSPTLADLAQSLKRMGCGKIYLSTESLEILKKGSPTMPQKPTSSGQEPQPSLENLRKPEAKVVDDKQSRLDKLADPLNHCVECRLSAGRTNLVYGVGNPDADLMFVGEGPGRDEDLKGEPFVGRAGRLLTDMIQKGMKIRREDVYIANIVKCRPPDNRNPQPDEMEACLPNLIQQVRIVDPKVIVCLGATAVKGLLKERLGITKLRGNWRSFEGIHVMPTLHPAYLLRNPPAKKDAWEDLKSVIAFFNGEIDPTQS